MRQELLLLPCGPPDGWCSNSISVALRLLILRPVPIRCPQRLATVVHLRLADPLPAWVTCSTDHSPRWVQWLYHLLLSSSSSLQPAAVMAILWDLYMEICAEGIWRHWRMCHAQAPGTGCLTHQPQPPRL